MADGNLRPIDAIGGLDDRPLLVVRSKEDPIVPGRMIDELFAAAPDGQKELLVLPGMSHGAFEGAAGREHYVEKIVAFFGSSLAVSGRRGP